MMSTLLFMPCSAAPAVSSGQQVEEVTAAVLVAAREVLGADAQADQSLMEAGLDSLGACRDPHRCCSRNGTDTERCSAPASVVRQSEIRHCDTSHWQFVSFSSILEKSIRSLNS